LPWRVLLVQLEPCFLGAYFSPRLGLRYPWATCLPFFIFCFFYLFTIFFFVLRSQSANKLTIHSIPCSWIFLKHTSKTYLLLLFKNPSPSHIQKPIKISQKRNKGQILNLCSNKENYKIIFFLTINTYK
jgi:hypothetical protein